MRRILLFVLPAVLLTALAVAAPASSATTATFTPYSHTGVLTPRGLAVAGKYVWITDVGKDGNGAHVVRIDAATGVKRTVVPTSGAFLSYVTASRRYAWVMDLRLSNNTYSLLRINAKTMAVQRVRFSQADIAGTSYTQGPIVLADNYVWIPGARGILRVNTTTLKVSTIKSPLILGSPQSMAVDQHYIWLNASYGNVTEPNGHAPAFFVRVSLATGVVSKVSFAGVKGGFPIGDDGVNLWVMNGQGIQRINPSTDQVATITVPKSIQISFPQDAPSAVANGGIYFRGNVTGVLHNSVVRIGISSGLTTALSSPLLYAPYIIASAKGAVWAVNNANGDPGPVKQPVLVRIP